MGISLFLLSAFILFFFIFPFFKLLILKSKKVNSLSPWKKTILFFAILIFFTYILSFPLEHIIDFIYNKIILED